MPSVMLCVKVDGDIPRGFEIVETGEMVFSITGLSFALFLVASKKISTALFSNVQGWFVLGVRNLTIKFDFKEFNFEVKFPIYFTPGIDTTMLHYTLLGICQIAFADLLGELARRDIKDEEL